MTLVRRARPFGGAASLAAVLSLACSERHSTPNATTEPSPNANILPAPLASAADLTGGGQAGAAAAAESASAGRIVGDPEPPPESAPTDRPLPTDANGARDSAGYTLEGSFRWADTPAIAPDVPASLKDVAGRLELKVVIDLSSSGRMRFELDSDAFPLPVHSELRARTAYYGHVLVWPDETAYRVLPAGSLRALFAERRADVEPLLRPVLRPGGSGSLLGHRTVQTELETGLGVLLLEQAMVSGATAGELLCRLLVELDGAEPANDACRPERVPLFAQWRWAAGGTMSFAVTSLGDRKEPPSSTDLAVPPRGARWATGELPPSSNKLLTREELSHLLLRPIRAAVPNAKITEGVTFANETNLLEYLFLDGVPVMWLLPRSREHLAGPPSGKYQVAYRDFFGTALTGPSAVELPAFVRVGTPEPDGGPRQ
ncbi:MAG TPA: hypothetical protein VHU80_13085 [Polyangiaceae bacterium]|jgi:hypothetical protein|nr:hypothetical protein [Polyangiaceae bacterium]